jgi:hypothetical protein
VYTVNNDSNGAITFLEGFQINTTTGALSSLPGSPFVGLPTVDKCKFDQSGGEAFCSHPSGTKFSLLDTNVSTGALTQTIPDLTVPNNFPFAPTD